MYLSAAHAFPGWAQSCISLPGTYLWPSLWSPYLVLSDARSWGPTYELSCSCRELVFPSAHQLNKQDKNKCWQWLKKLFSNVLHRLHALEKWQAMLAHRSAAYLQDSSLNLWTTAGETGCTGLVLLSLLSNVSEVMVNRCWKPKHKTDCLQWISNIRSNMRSMNFGFFARSYIIICLTISKIKSCNADNWFIHFTLHTNTILIDTKKENHLSREGNIQEAS